MPRRGHLRSLLETLIPADSREAEHKARILRLLEETATPFRRDQFLPGHVTASGFVVNAERNALLLILHRKLGRWLQPGGHIEQTDADVAAAAAREVREEVGLSNLTPVSLLDVDVHAIPAHGVQPSHEHFDVRFLFCAGDQSPCASSEVRAARWVPIDELLHAGSDAGQDESVLRVVRKLAHAEA